MELQTVKRRVPLLIFLLGLAWHLLALTGPTWDKVKKADGARDFASYYYATQAADQGLDPYLTSSLSKLARQEKTRGSVHPFFYPPPFLLSTAWTLPMTLTQGYRAWFWLDSLWLALSLAALWRWLPGPATLAAIGLILGTFTPLHDNHWMGQANLPVLAATLWGLYLAYRGRPILGGALMGVACMMKMSPGLLVAWWLFRGRWRAAASACVTAVILSVAALPLVDFDTQLRFYREVLPGFASGDYNGLKVSILLPGNHSVPNLWAQLYGAKEALPSAARWGASLSNLALLALLGWRLRAQSPDALGEAAAAAAVSCVMLLIPVYTYEHHMVQMIFPLIAAAAAISAGRLGRAGALGLALAYVPLAWWWSEVAGLSKSLGGVGGWLVQESKFLGLLVVGGLCAAAARGGGGSEGEDAPDPGAKEGRVAPSPHASSSSD